MSWFFRPVTVPTPAGAYTLTVSTAAVTLAGSSVTLRVARQLSVTTSAIALTGSSVSLRVARKLTVSTAAVTLAGQSVSIRTARRVTVSTSAVTLTGSSVNLRVARKISVSTNAVTLTGSGVTLRATRNLTVNTAAVTLAGASVNLRVARQLSVSPANVTLTGSPVTLTYAGLAVSYTLTVNPSQIVLTGSNVNLTAGQSIPAVFYQPGGFYPAPDRNKKRREVIDDAVEQAAEYVAQAAQLPSIPIDDAQIRAIAARIRKAVPQPVKGASAKAWQADNEAIMKAIDAEISRLIAERKESDEYMGLAMMLVMAS